MHGIQQVYVGVKPRLAIERAKDITARRTLLVQVSFQSWETEAQRGDERTSRSGCSFKMHKTWSQTRRAPLCVGGWAAGRFVRALGYHPPYVVFWSYSGNILDLRGPSCLRS